RFISETPDGLVFTTKLGTPVHKSNLVNRSFRRVLERAGLPRIRFHDLRHSAATLLLKEEINPKVVQMILGHSSVSTTLDIYCHVLPSMIEDVPKTMDKLLAA
ncbi:MAG: site-specific integrase, partial [bacterium]|nr:site-specific integrase [bacterium]